MYISGPKRLFLSRNMKTASCQLGELGPGHRRMCVEKGDSVCCACVCMIKTYLCVFGCSLCTVHYQFAVKSGHVEWRNVLW